MLILNRAIIECDEYLPIHSSRFVTGTWVFLRILKRGKLLSKLYGKYVIHTYISCWTSSDEWFKLWEECETIITINRTCDEHTPPPPSPFNGWKKGGQNCLQRYHNTQLKHTFILLRSLPIDCPHRMASGGKCVCRIFCTSVRLVVTGSSNSFVIPLYL